MSEAKLTPYLLFTVAVINIGSLLFGYHLAELNAPEAVIRCKVESSGLGSKFKPCIEMSDSDFGLVTAIFSFGGLFGAISAGSLSDRYGRKGVIMMASFGFIVGPIFMAIAQNIGTMALGRVISGLSAGGAVVVGPLYIHDVAPHQYAGVFGASTQVTINIGILVAQTLGMFLSSAPYWRIILLTGGLFGLLQLVLLPFCVESPKWLLSVDSFPAAKSALIRIRGTTEVEDELALMRRNPLSRDAAAIDEDAAEGLLQSPSTPAPGSHKKVSLLSFITSQEHRRPMVAIVGIMLAQQFLGINAIVMYGVSILRELLPTSSALINVIISVVNLFVTITAARFIDKVGRKPLLLMSIFGMGVFSTLLALGIIFRIKVMSALSTVLFVSSFATGLGPLPFMIAAEMVEHRAVGAAQSTGLTVNWLSTFAVAYGFPIVRSTMGNGNVFFLFSGAAVVFFIFVGRYVPETKGKRSADEVWGITRRED